ncbi:FecR family protein [Labilibaculum sp.]|uniref:FecR family protein n=1 Tax=Labilibaculum sp. TaxID=2060723 RepID=UPI0035673DC1
MNHIRKQIEISALLCKQRSGVISEKEQIVLDEWKNASLENEALFYQLNSEAFMDEKEKIYNGIDSQQAWLKLQSKLQFNKVKKHQLFTGFLQYAALVFGILLVLSVFIFRSENIQEQDSEMIIEQVKPGGNKAVLVLSDGSRIDLEKKKDTLIEDHVLNRDSKLIYDKNSKLAERIKTHWHKLFVPVGGEYQLQLSDGTKVWMNSDSQLRYPDRFTGKNRVVFLSGEAYFKVSKDVQHRFVVKTNKLNVKVYGTEFNLMAYKDDQVVEATLSEGSILVDVTNDFGQHIEHHLQPNMQCSYSIVNNNCRVIDVDARKYSGWKEGKLQFVDESLDEITRKLERWYNVKFFFQSERVKAIRYTGELKKFADFKLILNLLEIGTDVKFIVKNKVVIVQG